MVQLMVVAAAVLAFALPSSAQVYSGRIDITVTDSSGAILPGTLVEISGPQRRTATADASGEVRFLNLPPGTYSVKASLEGFADYSNPNVPVGTGVSVPLKVMLEVGAITQELEVTAVSPIVDPTRLSTQTNVTLAELQNVPSARDPWVVLQTVPGVIVDRVNVGGAESGQQSNYQAKGAASGDNTWTIDGVPITDMAALGSSPAYYDFDMFQEMQASTGGADLSTSTPGVALNLVLKSGSNTPHGSTRIYYESEGMQANNLPSDLAASLGGVTGKGNRIDEYKDYGFELGGPIFRDRLWGWGAYGKTDVTLITLANTPDQTILDNRSLKFTGQATDKIRPSYTYFRGDKLKYGRNASPTRPPETTWDQSGPSPVHKVESDFAISNNLFLTARYGYVGGGFQLTPQGGLDTNWFIDDGGVHRGSYLHYETVRPQHTVAGEGSYFRGQHEVKFGFGWRRADVDSTSIVPGNGILTYHDGYPSMIAEVTAWNHNVATRGKYTYFYVGDTIRFDRLTLTAGLRVGQVAASVRPLTQEGNPNSPFLPDITGIAEDDVVKQTAVNPRIGLSYALDADRRTLLRASYGSFTSQLNATTGLFRSAVQYRGVYYYDVVDTNGNRFVDVSEIAGRTCTEALAAAGDCNFYGFDIANPTALDSPIHQAGDYGAPLTHEVQFGIDREIMPDFAVSGTFTWREFTNFNWRNNGVVGTDYAQIDTFNFSHPAVGSVSVPVYGATRVPEIRSATTFRSRDGYSQRYLGFEVSATKRLSNRWMARFGFSTNAHKEYFDGPAAHGDPTPLIVTNSGLGSVNLGTGPNIDGGDVLRTSTGSGKGSIYQVLPRYQFILTGMYQAPWGVNLAMNMVNRQGFSTPYFHSQVPTADPLAARKSVLLVSDVAANRLPSVTSLDARLGKEFRFDRFRVNLDLDVFNVLNANTVLGRQYDLRLTTANNVLEIMNPRVLRLGARFGF